MRIRLESSEVVVRKFAPSQLSQGQAGKVVRGAGSWQNIRFVIRTPFQFLTVFKDGTFGSESFLEPSLNADVEVELLPAGTKFILETTR